MEKETEIVPVEVITTALEKQNVTRTVLDGLKKYQTLKIENLEDKDGYNAVRTARIECKNLRVLAEKICKNGREEAVQVQKAWIAKEKEVVGEISETESYLKEQEDLYTAEKKRLEIEKRDREMRKVQDRVTALHAVGDMIDYFGAKALTDGRFAERLATSTEAYNDAQALKAEQEALQQAERERLEAQRLEQEAKERELAEERERIEKEKREIEAKKQAEEEERVRKEELEQAQKEAAEKARIETERRLKEEAEAKQREEDIRKADEERKRLALSDAEKMRLYVTALIDTPKPQELKTVEALALLDEITNTLRSFIPKID